MVVTLPPTTVEMMEDPCWGSQGPDVSPYFTFYKIVWYKSPERKTRL